MNGRNNLTPSKALVLGRRNYASKLILYIDFILVDINFPIKWQNDHHFFLAANRSTDSRTSWFFSSLCVRYKPREVASRKKKFSQVHSSLFPKACLAGYCGSGSYRSLPFPLTGMVRLPNRTLLAFHFITGLATIRLYLLLISLLYIPSQTFNSVHQSPCQVASSLLAVCNGGRKE